MHIPDFEDVKTGPRLQLQRANEDEWEEIMRTSFSSQCFSSARCDFLFQRVLLPKPRHIWRLVLWIDEWHDRHAWPTLHSAKWWNRRNPEDNPVFWCKHGSGSDAPTDNLSSSPGSISSRNWNIQRSHCQTHIYHQLEPGKLERLWNSIFVVVVAVLVWSKMSVDK